MVPNDIIVEVSNHILDKEQYDNAILDSKINQIIVMPNRLLEFHMKDGSILKHHWEHRSRSKSWTPEMKEQARERSILQHQGGKKDA
jgi:hypothetical protein